ncbi:MAG: flagellar biosynthesis protein FlhF [Syntrophales bacterium]
MQVKRYEVANIREASAMIKNDLGPDAIILSTKRIHGGKGARIEVVAGKDDSRNSSSESQRSAGQHEPQKQDLEGGVGSMMQEIADMKAMLREMREEERPGGEWREFKEMLETLFDMFGLKKGESSHHPLSQVYRHLTTHGMSRDRASKLIATLRQEGAKEISSCEAGLARIEQCISRRLAPLAQESAGKRVKVFLGATGVGKTTTIAKLASLYALEKKVDVGLITMDTFRIAAVEQLKTYARIIGVPLEVATDKAAFQKSLQRMAAKDVIFVDTPGKNCRDDQYLQGLNDYLDLSVPVEVSLLLSMNSSESSLRETGQRFGKLPYDRIILTKVDECPQAGFVFNIIEQLAKPVSYMTNGQNVPFDIEKASPAKVARLIVRNTLH